MFILWAHFRAGKGEQFTLARIATALDKSDIPSQFGRMKREERRGEDAGHWEENVIREYGERIVTLDKGDDTLRFVAPDAGQALWYIIYTLCISCFDARRENLNYCELRDFATFISLWSYVGLPEYLLSFNPAWRLTQP